MAKSFVSDGPELATLRSTMSNDDSDSVFSGFLSTLVKWLLGTIILSPDLRSDRHFVATFDPEEDLGLFRAKQHLPHC